MRWIIVADSTRCRLFAQEWKFGGLEELDDLVRPRGKLRERDLYADRPGRAFDSAGTGRHALARSSSAREEEASKFAHEIARKLDSARKQNSLDGVVLIAEPQFLGMMREKLNGPLRRLIELEVPANLIAADVEKIHARIAKHLHD